MLNVSGKPYMLLLMIIVLLTMTLTACQTVKPYQRVYLNDENMQAGKRPLKKFASQVHTYREGGSGGGRGKTSGGCGCN